MSNNSTERNPRTADQMIADHCVKMETSSLNSEQRIADLEKAIELLQQELLEKDKKIKALLESRKAIL